MRIINVVKIKLGVVDEIESFGVIEEQLVDDVVEQAEKAFLKAAKEMGADTEDEDVVNELLDNAYYEISDNDGPFVEQQSVCLSWSDIDN